MNLTFNFDFQKYGLDDYFKHLVAAVSFSIMMLIVVESFFVKNEWNLILQDFIDVEAIFEGLNLRSKRLTNFKKILILLPLLVYFGLFFVNRLNLFLAIRIYVLNIMFATKFMTVVLYVIYCWNIKNHYRNLMLYLNETHEMLKIKQTNVAVHNISTCLQILNKLSMINLRANNFFMLKITIIMGN